MKTRTLVLAAILLTAFGAAAQQKQRVRAGGPGGGEDVTRDWPKAAARPNMSDAEIVTALGTYLDALAKKDLFSGTVLVAKNGQPLFTQSYGLASKSFNVPNNNDTKYNLGSINKLFTHLALIQLRDAGKIDFDQPLRKYLPDYPNPLADKITIRQMIEMKSGMGDFFGPKFMSTPKDGLRSLKDYLPLFVDKPLEFEPGTSRRYSNAGYVVLGMVIEKLSGQSYYDYVRENIYKPAGMRDTDSYESDSVVANRAVGYTRMGWGSDLPNRRADHFIHGARGSSAGGGYSTAPDMLRFVNAYLAGKIIGRASLLKRAGMPAGTPADAPIRMGTGWAGGSPGVNASVEVEDRWALIVLSNYDPPVAEEVMKNVRALIGQPVED